MNPQGRALDIHQHWTLELEAEVRAAAEEAGFHLSGIAGAEPGPATSQVPDGDLFASWIEQGRAGEMDYLKRRDESGRLLRSGLRVAIPWAHSVVVCALNYASAESLSIDQAPPSAGWIGRYAWSGSREDGAGNSQASAGQNQPGSELRATDYHQELLRRLREVEARLLERAPCQTRCYVDTGPIVERDFAARAGIGWIGKNTCVINQELGSWLLLGVIVTSLPISQQVAESPAWNIAPDRCGSCTRCIEACPTDALVAPGEMDASRCIAYLTTEKKGAIDPELREPMGRQVFGCDICQDVCPWNKRHRSASHRRGNQSQPPAATPGMEVRQELVNPPLTWLAAMDSSQFKRWFKGSPLERTGKKRLHRNVAIAMGNSGQPEFLPQLLEWAAGEDTVLAEAAGWAIERIGSASIGS